MRHFISYITPLQFSILFLIGLCSLGCGGNAPPSQSSDSLMAVDSFQSALPHGQALPERALTEADKRKLAVASGKTARIIEVDTLVQLIARDTQQLYIYQFWQMDCAECLANNEHLQTLQAQQDFELILIHVGHESTQAVNAYIREHSFVNPAYYLDFSQNPNWNSLIEPGWSGKLPALLISKTSEALHLFYQQPFSQEELEALINSLSL